MPSEAPVDATALKGHALRDAHLRDRSLVRAQSAPLLARAIVGIRAGTLGLTRLEFARRSGISRGTLRDMELGVHTPTRHTLRKFVTFCRQAGVAAPLLDELRSLYAGEGGSLEQFISRLELQAGSPRELARRAGISPATLWEYRRGNFPLPFAILLKLCEVVDEDPGPAEAIWHATERQRLLDRGYPAALAEFWVWCARNDLAEKHLFSLGISTSAVRRLRYLELPAWKEVAGAARSLCPDEETFDQLQKLWTEDEARQRGQRRGEFGPHVQQLRKRLGIGRRELADLFHIGGKKPARIIKYIEEDGFYSAQAYPAGIVALLSTEPSEQDRLLDMWRRRRRQFHRRHRPEMLLDLRLVREIYGFTLEEMRPILGYSSLEYQKIERGVMPIAQTAQGRIIEAIQRAGEQRLQDLLGKRADRDWQRGAWKSPPTVAGLITLLAQREGGLIPLSRRLRQADLKGLWIGRLRAIARGQDVPAWYVLEQIGTRCEVPDLTQVKADWLDRYRLSLRRQKRSPLGVELRLLIAESAPTLRDFSPVLECNYSVLLRDLQRIDRDEPIKWFHVERILLALHIRPNDDRWREFRALWATSTDRRKTAAMFNHSRANGVNQTNKSKVAQ